MIAAKLFNQKNAESIHTTYGAVTTGNIWKFLKYEGGKAVFIDQKEYHINFPGKIVGVLTEMAKEKA